VASLSRCALAISLALVACDPPPPAAAPTIAPAYDARPRYAPPPIDANDPPPAMSSAKPPPPMPPPTGDRELDALRVGFYGCRVMGLRIMPTMDGTAVLRATLGPGGEVLDVTPDVVIGIPHTVVACLIERVRNASFGPRGGDGSILVIPVDFRQDGGKSTPTPASTLPTKAI
jgi:hypothetical protein